MINMLNNYRLPPIESILEVLLTKTKAEEKLKDEALVLALDAVNYLSGNTISFLEFAQVNLYKFLIFTGNDKIKVFN